jgi:lipoyl(octanoyl) transferase
MAYKLLRLSDQIGYQDALDLQAKVFELVDNHIYDGVLIILEHKPVLTMGIRTDQNNLLVSKEYLNDHGVELFHTDRGGDITFHGPGQIVAYPILRFREFGLKLSEYMHRLEQVIIDTLSHYDIIAYSKPEFPGVWVDDKKLCAIGVRAKKFIVYHGLAFNVNVDKSYFNLINPCGITDYEITTMSDIHSNPDIETVKDTVISMFNSAFGVTFKPLKLEDL